MENKPTIREELPDWREELYQAFHNLPLSVDARTQTFHKIAKVIDEHWLNKIKEVVGEVDVPYEKMTDGQVGWFNGRNDERQRILKEFGIIK